MMSRSSILLASVLTLALGPLSANAADKYWDRNADTAGSGGPSPTGTWDTATANWSTDPTGAIATEAWVASDTAIFSAGTDATGAYTVTASGDQTAAGIIIEEGTVTFAGPDILIGTGTVELKAGTGLVTAAGGGATNQGLTFAVGGKYLISGDAMLRTTQTGAAGSFVNTNAAIELANNANLSIDYQVTNVLNIITSTTIISGAGSLVKTGPGVIAIASPSTYTGSTTINDGELRIRTTSNRLPIATNVAVNGTGILNLNSVSQQIASLTGNGQVGLGNATLTIDGSTSTTFAGAVKNVANAGAGAVSAGNGRIIKNGTSTITFDGLNDLTGSVTLNTGGITVGAAGSLCGDTADLTVNGGTLTLNQAAEKIENLASTTADGTINLANAALSLITDPVASTIYSGKLTGPGGLTKSNALSTSIRTLTLSGNNDYTGNTIIDGGMIAVAHDSALGTTAGYTEVNATDPVGKPAVLLFTGATTNFTVAEPIRIKGAGTTNEAGAIAVIAGANPTLSGPISLIGDATVTVSSTSGGTFNNAAAFTSLNNENLTLQGGSGTGTGGVIDGVINLGTGSLNKLQNGKWDLRTDNIYSGGTTIGAGTLLANNTSGSATGTGAVTLSGATSTLGGNGTVNGPVAVNAGSIAPGTSIGTLSVTSDVTMAATSHLAIELDGANADRLNVGGTLDLSALDNSLDVSVVNAGAGPWTIASYGVLAPGSLFETITPGYSVSYGDGSSDVITLMLAAAGLLGDFNSDNSVDAADYVTWRENDVANNPLPNDNGLLSQADRYDLWKANFGNSSPGSGAALGAAAAVPEPATLVLLLAAAALATIRRSSRK